MEVWSAASSCTGAAATAFGAEMPSMRVDTLFAGKPRRPEKEMVERRVSNTRARMKR
jgi:hypothetical protein